MIRARPYRTEPAWLYWCRTTTVAEAAAQAVPVIVVVALGVMIGVVMAGGLA